MWLKPTVILFVLFALIGANIIEFRAKRRQDKALLVLLRDGSPQDQLAAGLYCQSQNIEQLLHVAVSILVALLVSSLWP